MRIKENKWRISSRDIWHVKCRHCTKLSMALAAGSTFALNATTGFEETGEKIQFLQGNEYEDLRFSQIAASLPDGDFIELEKYVSKERTLEVLGQGVPVVGQAYLEVDYGHSLLTGYSDLLVREDYELHFESGSLQARKIEGAVSSLNYVPFDIKHTSKSKDAYWWQVASYLEALQVLGLASTQNIGIITKTEILRVTGEDALVDLGKIREPLFNLLSETSPSDAAEWSDLELHCIEPSTCTQIFCDFPKLCKADRIRLDLFTQLYNNGRPNAAKLENAGVKTVAQLAGLKHSAGVEGVSGEALVDLIQEAQLIINHKANREPRLAKKPGATLFPPEPSRYDIFFDLEWFNPLLEENPLYYVFGTVDSSKKFTYFEAHNKSEERQSLIDFVDYCLSQISHDPNMHIYHWHNPEAIGLTKMAELHDTYQKEVKNLLKYFVDLRLIAKDMLVVGVGGYSIKQLESYYSLDDSASSVDRGTDTKDGADSMVQYYKYEKALEAGDSTTAYKLLNDIFDYNKNDCVSTLEAYHWLRKFS